MGTLKKDDIGCLVLVVILLIATVFAVRNYREKERRIVERKRNEVARIDSLSQIKQSELKNEYNEHLLQFYDAFNKYYPLFSSPNELDEWLSNANFAAFDLLVKLYSKKYDGYDGIEGFNKLSEYLYWGPPLYEVECETCGSTVTFSEGDLN